MIYTHTIVENTLQQTKLHIEFEISEIEPFKKKQLEKMAKKAKIQGFREGKAPLKLVEAKFSLEIFQDALDKAINVCVDELLKKENFVPVSKLDLKLDPAGSSDKITFDISFVNYPKFSIPEINSSLLDFELTTSDAPTEDEIIKIAKTVVRKALSNEEIFGLTSVIYKEEVKEEEKTNSNFDDFELNDKLVYAVDKSETVEIFLEKVKAELSNVNSTNRKNEFIDKLLKNFIKASTFEAPELLVTEQVKFIESDLESKLKSYNIKKDDYLKAIGTDLESFNAQNRTSAIDTLTYDFVLSEVAKTHNIKLETSDLENELNKITDPEIKKSYLTESGISQLYNIITKRKSINFLLEKLDKKEYLVG